MTYKSSSRRHISEHWEWMAQSFLEVWRFFCFFLLKLIITILNSNQYVFSSQISCHAESKYGFTPIFELISELILCRLKCTCITRDNFKLSLSLQHDLSFTNMYWYFGQSMSHNSDAICPIRLDFRINILLYLSRVMNEYIRGGRFSQYHHAFMS